MRRSCLTLTLICEVMFAVGCHSAMSTGGNSGSGGQPPAASYTAELSSRMTTAPITDPTLNNMVSSTLTIPAGWKLQGISMIMPCTSIGPASIYRAYSPDGLMQMRGEPPMGWKWDPTYKTDQSGCANIAKAISAADFLTYYISTMQGGVHVVAPMPVPAVFSQWAANFAAPGNQNNARLPAMMQTNTTWDTAALRVEVVNGSFVVEERLLAGVVCAVKKEAMYGGQCFARMAGHTTTRYRLTALPFGRAATLLRGSVSCHGSIRLEGRKDCSASANAATCT